MGCRWASVLAEKTYDRQAAFGIGAVVDARSFQNAVDAVLRAEKGYDAETGNCGCSILSQYIDRSALMGVYADLISQHSKSEVPTVPGCNLF